LPIASKPPIPKSGQILDTNKIGLLCLLQQLSEKEDEYLWIQEFLTEQELED